MFGVGAPDGDAAAVAAEVAPADVVEHDDEDVRAPALAGVRRQPLGRRRLLVVVHEAGLEVGGVADGAGDDRVVGHGVALQGSRSAAGAEHGTTTPKGRATMTSLDRQNPRVIRAVAAAVTIVCVTVVAVVLVHRSDDDASITHTAAPTSTTAPGHPARATPTTSSTLAPLHAPAGPPSTQRRMTLAYQIGGDISPKSVDASGRGLVFAQNMMYRHTMTVYDSQGHLVKTIPDSVDLAAFGYPRYPGALYRGAPVELAYAPDGRHAYVSNYSMYGAGFGPEGTDACIDRDEIDSSFVYRVDLRTLAIDQVDRGRQGPEVRGHHTRRARTCS